ncbi:MAG: sigma-E processing peptidase SpoIIGA, partial [Clostridia bacterium]|nr:sigma-E processing peptidase SpoIIGA [Clostridia bacterium]
LMCAALCFITFGFGDIKAFLRSAALLFVVNFSYSGAMIAVWLIFKPYGMVINNSVVYFDISPLFLILFSVIGYFAVILLRKILKKNFSENIYCDVTVNNGTQSVKLSGIVDSGNSLTDVFGLSQIFITEQEVVNSLLGEEIKNPARFRKIPCSTVAGEKLLDGYRIDSAVILYNNKKYNFKNPVLAVSSVPLIDSKIIVNPENLN